MGGRIPLGLSFRLATRGGYLRPHPLNAVVHYPAIVESVRAPITPSQPSPYKGEGVAIKNPDCMDLVLLIDITQTVLVNGIHMNFHIQFVPQPSVKHTDDMRPVRRFGQKVGQVVTKGGE
jgi:hypothetical protein